MPHPDLREAFVKDEEKTVSKYREACYNETCTEI